MTFEVYQHAAHKTAIYPNVIVPGYQETNVVDFHSGTAQQAMRLMECPLAYPALGLAGEAGELANKVKKVLRDDGGAITEERRKDLLDELGDVLWYVAELATCLGGDLQEVAAKNIEKLQSRAERGKLQGQGDQR